MSKKRILVVEDEAITATDIKFKLIDMGYDVVGIAETGEKAIELATELRPDLTLMDITLKGEMSGIEASAKVLSLDIPVIYLTAHSDDETFLKANAELPASGYVIKPFDEKKFQRTIQLALNRQSIEEEKVNIARGIINKKPPETKTKSSRPQAPKKEEKTENEKSDKTRILVVEDEVITALDIQLKLQDLGFDVPKTAATGPDAINLVEELNPDLILMDIMLKGEMNGIEVTDALKYNNIPIVYLTANTDNSVIEKALETSPYGYIAKPFTDIELKHGVMIALKKHEANMKKISEIQGEMKEKNKEVEVEQMNLLFFIGIIVALIASGFYAHNMEWLAILLMIPTVFSLILLWGGFKKNKPSEKFEKPPFVSIMVPIYNKEETIEESLKEFAKIDYSFENKTNYEIIAINDGSTDKTGEILTELKKEIDCLKIVTRKLPRAREGRSYVLNEGLEIAKGEAIAILNCESYVEPNFLKTSVGYLKEEGVKAVQSNINTKGKGFLSTIQNIENMRFDNVLKSEDNLKEGGTLGEDGFVIMKDALEEIGDWDNFALTEDLNIGIKLLIKGHKIRFNDKTTVHQQTIDSWSKYFKLKTQWNIGKIETLFIYFKDLMKANVPIIRKITSLEHLLRFILDVFVQVGFVVLILELLNLMNLTISPIIIGIILLITFFPNLLKGLNHGEGIGKAIIHTIEYWIYSFINIPLFIYVLIKVVRKENKGTVYYRSS